MLKSVKLLYFNYNQRGKTGLVWMACRTLVVYDMVSPFARLPATLKKTYSIVSWAFRWNGMFEVWVGLNCFSQFAAKPMMLMKMSLVSGDRSSLDRAALTKWFVLLATLKQWRRKSVFQKLTFIFLLLVIDKQKKKKDMRKINGRW
jgi:hypothetical protein